MVKSEGSVAEGERAMNGVAGVPCDLNWWLSRRMAEEEERKKGLTGGEKHRVMIHVDPKLFPWSNLLYT